MPRLHLIEIGEQPWCPRAIRDGLTDYLQLAGDVGKVYAPIAPRLAHALRRTRAERVIDLGAGAGGPWRSLLPALAEHGVRPQVRLTDRQPNRDAFVRIAKDTQGAVTGEQGPVDATAVPAELTGMRTIFSALHHFRPRDARRVLGDAAERGEAIGAFEATRRDAKAIALMLLTPLIVLLVTPKLRPFRLSRFFWTYLIPAIPLLVLFDGVVSCLRTYSVAELQQLTEGLGGEGYRWEVGETGDGPIPVTYVIGLPPTP